MGTNTLETAYSNGQIIDASHVNEITAAIINQFVGRNTSGVPEAGKSLGTAAIPWGAVHADSVILDGQAVDTSKITSLANRIISGATRADSDQPDFLRADGTVGTLTLLGATTNLTLAINAMATTVSTDIVKTGLTLAPSTNNTCLVNDVNAVNDLYLGEDERDITVDTMGSEIVSKIGQYVGLQTATGEIMYAFVKDATTLTNVFRGYFFDDTGAPIVRGNLSDNDTLTLINLGWVFVEDNGTTVDLSYTQPTYSFEAPAGPVTGQYWFDIPNQTWKRYSGTEFEIINRILVGVVALDDTAAIATRSADFTNSFSEQNSIELIVGSPEIVESKSFENRVNVYGTEIIQDVNKLSWNMTTDLEGGVSETASTYYYLYLSNEGERVISDVRPYDRKDLKGRYHPYHTWRLIGECFNDGANDVISTLDENSKIFARYTSDAGATTNAGNNYIYEDKEHDNSSGYDVSTGEFVCRRTTRMHFMAQRADASATSFNIKISVNGVAVQKTSQPIGANGAVFTVFSQAFINLNFGDVVAWFNGGGSNKTNTSDPEDQIMQVFELEKLN